MVYNSTLSGDIEVPAPDAAKMNNIADNWAILDTHTDKFTNYYTALGYSTDGTDGAGNVVLLYTGNENLEEVSIQVIDVNNNDTETAVSAAGAFARTSLTNFINGVAPWGQTTKQVTAMNGNVVVSVIDQDTDALNGDILAEVIAEIEAVIAEGPMVAEETVEETAEEVPAE